MISEESDFDPSEPSSAELLEEWVLAIRSMTTIQAVERITWMILEEYDRIVRDPSWAQVRKNPPTIASYVLDRPTRQTQRMLDAFRNVWWNECEIRHRDLMWFFYEVKSDRWTELARHPLMNEDRTLDLDMTGRTDIALVSHSSSVFFEKEKSAFASFTHRPFYSHEGTCPGAVEHIAFKMSYRLGLPLIPFRPGTGGRVDDVFTTWVRWAHVMANAPRDAHLLASHPTLHAYLGRQCPSALIRQDLFHWIVQLDTWEHECLAPEGYSWRQRILDSDPKHPGWVPPCVPWATGTMGMK
jgi:hypothetical protein